VDNPGALLRVQNQNTGGDTMARAENDAVLKALFRVMEEYGNKSESVQDALMDFVERTFLKEAERDYFRLYVVFMIGVGIAGERYGSRYQDCIPIDERLALSRWCEEKFKNLEQWDRFKALLIGDASTPSQRKKPAPRQRQAA
jgi:hypothetical protein